MPEQSKYAVPLSELEDSAHVPLDEQVTEQPEPPVDQVEPEDLDRLRLLGTTAAGRLRPRG